MIKILVTIGPVSLDKKNLKFYARYTNLFRLNGSHNTLDWHQSAINLIKEVVPNSVILMDIPGVKPRTANQEPVNICAGQEVIFGEHHSSSEIMKIPLTRLLPKYNGEVKNFSINDGQSLFDVVDYGQNYIIGKSRQNLTLLPRKGINIPLSVYDEDQQFLIYTEFLSQVSKLKVDGFGLSFVQTGELIDRVRKLYPSKLMVSKVENSLGLQNCAEISSASDIVMIDRGDLAAEIGFENLFQGVEEIAQLTKLQGKPLIMATENLETMVHRETPSKSEVMSIAHSAKIGTDCFMLSEETATSSNGTVIVSWLNQFLKSSALDYTVQDQLILKDGEENTVWRFIEKMPDIPVMIMSKSGRALHRFLASKPDSEVFLLTNNQKIISLVGYYRNKVQSFRVSDQEEATVETLLSTISKNKNKIFCNSKFIMAIYVSKYINKPSANSITIFEASSF